MMHHLVVSLLILCGVLSAQDRPVMYSARMDQDVYLSADSAITIWTERSILCVPEF